MPQYSDIGPGSVKDVSSPTQNFRSIEWKSCPSKFSKVHPGANNAAESPSLRISLRAYWKGEYVSKDTITKHAIGWTLNHGE